MNRSLFFGIFLLIAGHLVAQNPLVTHMFTADPTARVFDGKLYVYPSHDVVPPRGVERPRFCMPDYHIFSLEGVTWTDHGRVLDQNEVPWGKKNSFGMWAPDCIKKDGKYYYYYPAEPEDKSAFRRIGVGVSDNPTGPFKWEKDYIKGVSGIDPGLLLDEDNKAYLYFGGGEELFGAPLKSNMKELAAKAIKIEGLPSGYKEGSFVFKHKGLYYFTFAHVFADEGYTIGYATAKTPLGPFTYRGKIMDNITTGTNHHSIVNYEGKWILFYHWWDISGFNKLRNMRADYMTMKEDGSIKKVRPTMRGIGTALVGDTIQIDRHSEIKSAETAFVGGGEPNGWMVCNTMPGSYVRYDRVNFTGAKKVQARVACGQRVGSFELRLNHAKGKKLAEFKVQSTGGWNQWETFEADMLEEVEGTHNLVVVFNSEWGLQKIVNMNWLILE